MNLQEACSKTVRWFMTSRISKGFSTFILFFRGPWVCRVTTKDRRKKNTKTTQVGGIPPLGWFSSVSHEGPRLQVPLEGSAAMLPREIFGEEHSG